MSLGDGRELDRLRVRAHPLRLRILSLLTGVELSASDVARELGITQANASYHLRRLAAAGELVEVGTQKVRGGVAKKYAYRHRDAQSQRSPQRTSPAQRLAVIDALATELRRRSADRSDEPSVLVDAEVWLEPEVWDQARALVLEAAELVHDRARPPRTTGTWHVSFVADLFTMKGGDNGPA